MFKDPMGVLKNPVIAGNNTVNAPIKNAIKIGINITIPYNDLVKKIDNDGLQKLIDAAVKELARRGIKA